MPSNSGKPLDSAGNLQVDFVWGNFAPQPNDVRTVASDTNVSTSTATAADLVDPNKKRIVPGKDNHDNTLAGWNGYPSFTGNDYGSYSRATNGTAVTNTQQYTYTPQVTVPKIDGLTDVNAKDALRDNGSTGTITGTVLAAGSSAGGRVQIIEAARAAGVAGTVTLKGTAHGFTTGDYVAVYGLTSTVATLNGVYGPITASTDTFTFAHTNTVSGAITNVTSITGAYAVVVSKSIATTVSGALAAGVFSLVAASTTQVTVGMTVTGTGFATGTTVQYLNGTTVGLSLPTTAAIANGASVTFASVPTQAVAARTVAYSGTATAGTATVNTVAAHGLNVGDSVSVIGSTVLAATTGIVASAATSLVVADATNIAASAIVTGPGITPGTTVNGSPTGTAVTLSGNSTAALVAQSVVTTGTATSGSTTLTIPTGTGVNVATNTADGHLVTGVGIPDGTYVSSGGGTTSITLSKATTLALSTTAVTFSLAKFASGTAGSTSLTVDNNTALVVGQTVVGAGILDGTIITAISGTTVTLSQAAFGTFLSKLVTFKNLLTFGTVATSKLNNAVTSNIVTSVLVTAVPSTTSFQFERTGLTGAATFAAASDNYVVTSATSTAAGVTLNVASGKGVAGMVGAIVTGAGIPDGTFVTAVSTDALTISKPLTADPGATPLVFYPASVVPGIRTNTVVIGSQNISGAQSGATTVTYNLYN